MTNITITLNEDEVRALYTALELFEIDRETLIEEDEEWTPTFESIDSFYRKVKVEKAIKTVAKENPHVSRTIIRKVVLENLDD